MNTVNRLNKLHNEWKEAKEVSESEINQSKGRQDIALYANCFLSCKTHQNVVLYQSYWGRGMIDNPYAIFCELLTRKEYSKLKHIWVIDDFDDNKKEIERYTDYSNVYFVQYGSPEYMRALCEAKYLINNVTFPYWFIKKEDQVYVNTWHGTPLKSMGYEMKNGKYDSANTVRNFLCSDFLLSANSLMTQMYLNSYKMQEIMPGQIIEEGYPRNDLLQRTEKEDIFKQLEYYGIFPDRNKKIILYAPTWRQIDAGHAVINPDELLEVKQILEEKIDTDKYQILIKPHQLVYKELKNRKEYKGLLIPAVLDANEILSITDILISDYSSIFVDFMVLNRPILFYIPDLQEYIDQRGVQFSPDQLPGPYSDRIEDIAAYVNNIEQVQNEYKTVYETMRQSVCVLDDGHVSERIVDIVFNKKKLYRNGIKAIHTKKRLLLGAGVLWDNGITHSLLSLLEQIDYSEWDVTVFATAYKKDVRMLERVESINANVRVLIKCGHYVATLDEEERKYLCTTKGLYRNIWDKIYPWKMLKREWHRNFGSADFDYVVDFGGYDSTVAPLILCGEAKKKSIWLHSDIKADMNRSVNGEKTVWRSLHFNVSLYPKYDHLVSCSRLVMKVNQEKLGTSDTYDKYTYASNTIDKERIEQGLNSEDVISCRGG